MTVKHTKSGDVWKVHKKWFRRNAPDFWREIEARVAREDGYHAREKAQKQAAKAA